MVTPFSVRTFVRPATDNTGNTHVARQQHHNSQTTIQWAPLNRKHADASASADETAEHNAAVRQHFATADPIRPAGKDSQLDTTQDYE